MSVIDPETGDAVEDDVAPVTPKRKGRVPYPRDAQGNIIRPDGTIGRQPRVAARKTTLEAEIGGMITMWNTPISMVLPKYALEPTEIIALAKALDQQCQTSPKFRKYMEKALQGIGGVSLIGVLAVIVGRRVVRSGVVPIPSESPIQAEQIDALAGVIIASAAGQNPIKTGLAA